MKNILSLAILLLFAFTMMPSCRKDVQSHCIKEINIDTTLQAGSDYELDLIHYGDDDNIATIIKQASHFSISQLENLSDVFNPIYHYVSEEKATGSDQVVLAISKHPDVARGNRDSTIITINFTLK
jgi:hypothetical protein